MRYIVIRPTDGWTAKGRGQASFLLPWSRERKEKAKKQYRDKRSGRKNETVVDKVKGKKAKDKINEGKTVAHTHIRLI